MIENIIGGTILLVLGNIACIIYWTNTGRANSYWESFIGYWQIIGFVALSFSFIALFITGFILLTK